jgi:uncharacterized protein YjbI with pentapeptide repeats/energy-coupling factor transporter ATP-binding protein EcfA2
MEHTIVVGALIGAVVAFGVARAWHLGPSSLVFGVVLGAFGGAAGGICLALLWAVESHSDPASSRDLWDPWLDSGNPLAGADPDLAQPMEAAGAETVVEMDYAQPSVRPRVLSPETGESIPLDDVVGPILAAGETGAIRLVGSAGAGKTTALNHLAGLVPPHLAVTFLDEPSSYAIVEAFSHGWVVYTSASAAVSKGPATNLRLAPWGEDEWIEYLLARDRRVCASVMGRLTLVKPEAAGLGGIPELWDIVLRNMMGDTSVDGPGCALRDEFAAMVPDVDRRHLFECDCFAAVCIPARRLESLRRHHPTEPLRRLIRHRPVQLLLAADWVADAVKRRAEADVLDVTLPRDLVLEAALRIARDSESVDRLWSLTTAADRRIHPMVASLLHALRLGWKPNSPPPRLAGAYLEDASWAAIDLADADMRNVDFGGANLAGSRLDAANLAGANLAGANLSGASVDGVTFDKADLSRASLAQVRAQRSRFQSARLMAANLVGANLDQAILEGADLTRARLAEASLVAANLRSAKLEDADFSRANLSRAIMKGLTLSCAQFADARFTGADLSGCNLEGMHLPGANFADADLTKALLTGSQMPGADFSRACFRSAGLAEVAWEGADLRGADLREVAFHLGSSRSGLVGSPIACEGSRTGFYTDDSNEQDFKSPEEIRKANLCGADLRGARIDDVDFYLVDLRGATLDPAQIPQVRRSGAIIDART